MQLDDILKKLDDAKCPEDVFGALPNPDTAKDGLMAMYRVLAKALHPDKNPDDIGAATAAFARLSVWRDRALAKIASGTYGDRSGAAGTVITSKKGKYSIECLLRKGDLSDVYLAQDDAGSQVVIKLLRDVKNSDLMRNEIAVLRYIHEEWTEGIGLGCLQHIPRMLDTFKVKEGRVSRPALVLPYKDGMTLLEIDEAYANNLEYVDPRDAAWMINRTLGALLACHQAGYVHGALLPPHVYLHPKDHGGQLLDWSYAVKLGEPLKAIVPQYRSYYPPELVRADKSKRHAATFGSDLYMLAKCVLNMYDQGAKLPKPYAGMFRACLLSPDRRPQDVFEFFKEFQEVLAGLYGPKQFREFRLPTTTKKKGAP